MARWLLFLDESGDFGSLRGTTRSGEKANDHVAVGGWLIREEAPEFGPRSLQELLRPIAPWLPRPLHAAHLTLPAMHTRGGSALAASGQAAALVEAARANDPPPSLGADCAPWSADEASEWAKVVVHHHFAWRA